MTTFPILGAIISHAYLVAGVFPDRVAFLCLAAALLGPHTVLSDTLLKDSFVSCLSAHEVSVFRDAISFSGSQYPHSIQAELISILGCYGCKEAPRPANLNQLIIQAAHYTFFLKPAAALSMMNAGIPEIHRAFWKNMTSYPLYDSFHLNYQGFESPCRAYYGECIARRGLAVSSKVCWQHDYR